MSEMSEMNKYPAIEHLADLMRGPARFLASDLHREAVECWRELTAARERERELVAAIEAALRELGIPQPGYPAPIANAIGILRQGIASAAQDHTTS